MGLVAMRRSALQASLLVAFARAAFTLLDRRATFRTRAIRGGGRWRATASNFSSPASRPAVHQRRQSRRADFRVRRHRGAGKGGGDARPPAAQSTVRLARRPVHRARHGARRAARGARERQGRRGRRQGAACGSAGSARRGSRSNMRWAHAADYSALLFVRADDAATLERGSRRARRRSVLDLPEKEAREDAAKIEAVAAVARGQPDLAPDPRQRRRRKGRRGGRRT